MSSIKSLTLPVRSPCSRFIAMKNDIRILRRAERQPIKNEQKMRLKHFVKKLGKIGKGKKWNRKQAVDQATYTCDAV